MAGLDSAEPGGAATDPAQAPTRHAFLQALARRRVLTGDTFKQLEQRSGVPRSTLSDMLTRHRVPRREVVERVVGVYAASDREAARWCSRWSQLSLAEALPEAPPPGAPLPGPAPTGTAPTGTAPTGVPSAPFAPPVESGAGPAPVGVPRWRRWVVAGVVGATTVGGLVAAVAALPPTSGAPRPTDSAATTSGSSSPPVAVPASVTSPAGNGSPAALRVYNVEAGCRRPRTDTCALRLANDPRAARSVANRAGEVWHGDEVLAECVIDDGRAVTDEKLVSSRAWYYVHVPATGQAGWLPAVRVRTDLHLRAC